MTFDKHISAVCRSAHVEFRRISSIRQDLTVEATTLNCYNSLLSGCRLYLLGRLQKVQNSKQCTSQVSLRPSVRMTKRTLYRPGVPPCVYQPGVPPCVYQPGVPPCVYQPGVPPCVYQPGVPPCVYQPGLPPGVYQPGVPPGVSHPVSTRTAARLVYRRTTRLDQGPLNNDHPFGPQRPPVWTTTTTRLDHNDHPQTPMIP